MNPIRFWFRSIASLAGLGIVSVLSAAPIALHPANPHYFQWQGRPLAIITSGEHYGSVLNLDFDFKAYLTTLARQGMNGTRTFSGAYVEPQGAFNIARNTLAPSSGRFICPWARSDQPGYAGGGNRFDLTRWDPAYFQRLKEFIRQAERKGIIVEFTLFCPMYEDKQWDLSPMNTRNNVNGLGAIGRDDVHTLDRNGALLAVQETLTRKLVTELNGFDNLMFEICNEPYFGGVTLAWQHHIADLIAATERTLPKKHLITQNIANKSARIENPHPAVSVFNFHYAAPPDAVKMNYGLNKVIGDNETGFHGTHNFAYRAEAWEFMIAGGGLFNHLDYSFVAGHEDGTFVYPATQPGGGNTGFRQELRILREFLNSFDFLQMRPENSVIKGGIPTQASARALVQPGKAIGIYLRQPIPPPGQAHTSTSPHSPSTVVRPLQVELGAGRWLAEWIHPQSGKIVLRHQVEGGGVRDLEIPPYDPDIALRLKRR